MAQKGTISINAQNIMPIIKRWLYSDKDIFLREIVSNGCDAIAKHKMLSQGGQVAPEEDYRVTVTLDKENGFLSVSDNGIGMTQNEVERFIAQVAFSGAEEFLAKYKGEDADKGGIIGHFGLGFYSSFMVSKKVIIDTLSWQEGAQAVRWSSEDKEFLEYYTARQVLEKYCAFMPVPIYLNEIKPPEEPKEGEEPKETPNEEPKPVNDTSPLWLKKPSEVTDEEYLAFYHKVFRDMEDPLFWIHLNAEYPFNLKGILYFPRIKNEFTSSEGVIKLYNNQVFVADNIKEVIPEFLMLLKGAIDCPDLPLNVSRSFLQNDGYVRKMSAYITRKVADRLVSEFADKREQYEKYWDSIHPFVKYGSIRDEKFFDRVKDAILYKTTDDKYLTLAEYIEADPGDGKKTVFYTSDPKRQAQMVELYRQEGHDVVLLDTLIDSNFMSFMEYRGGADAVTFRRVDADTEGLTESGETDEEARKKLEEMFRKALDLPDLAVRLDRFKSQDIPAMVTVEEQSRRFSEMARFMGQGFSMPERKTLVLNDAHPLIAYLRGAEEDDDLAPTVCAHVMDLSEMARKPLESDRMVAFLKRSNEILTRLIAK